MKESTFAMLIGITLTISGTIYEGLAALMCFGIASIFLATSSICRAIERNGKER